MIKTLNNGSKINVLEIVKRKIDIEEGCLGYCIVKDELTGKKYIFGNESKVCEDGLFFYEAIECDDKGLAVKPINCVPVSYFIIHGDVIGYIFNDRILEIA